MVKTYNWGSQLSGLIEFDIMLWKINLKYHDCFIKNYSLLHLGTVLKKQNNYLSYMMAGVMLNDY